MSLLAILLLVWIAGYSLAAIAAKREITIPERYTVQGPLLLVHTERGKATIDRLARCCPRVWRVWGVAGVAFAGLGLLASAVLLGQSALEILRQPETAVIASDPKNLLVIPGVNDFLPLAATPALVIALVLGMVIHELGHAIYCRLGDINIDSTGVVLFALLPAGAFVQPDEESKDDASRWAQLQMVSAGVMNNFALTLISFALLVVLVSSVIVPAAGGAIGGVMAGSPADDAGIEAGDRITHVNGEAVSSNAEMQAALETDDSTVTVQTHDGETHDVSRQVFVAGIPQSESLDVGTSITHVNGQPVTTSADFKAAIETVTAPTATLKTADGESVSYPIGARVALAEDSPLTDVSDTADRLVITHVAGERIHSAEDLQAALELHDAGDRISVRALTVGESSESIEGTITLAAADAPGGKLGAQATAGVAGLSVADFGVQFYPVEQYLSFLGSPTLGAFALILMFPFASLLGLPFNFAGFTPDIANFYTVTESLAPVEGGVLFTASVLFWTVWLNINLALFNCFPTVALDGGHYLSLTVGETVERLGLPNPKQTSERVSKGLTYLFLLFLLIIAFYPVISKTFLG